MVHSRLNAIILAGSVHVWEGGHYLLLPFLA